MTASRLPELSPWAVAVLSLLGNFKAIGCAAQAVACRNKLGRPVDWWVALKFPGGGTYSYIDSETQVGDDGSLPWSVSYDLDQTTRNPLAATLQPVYRREAANGYAMWSDQFPGGRDFSGGAHAKGVLAIGPTQGFWLTHSFPEFPAAPCINCTDGNARGEYSGIDPSQRVYGQSAVCLTAATEQLDVAARVLGSNGVWVYSWDLPELLALRMPATAALMETAAYRQSALVPGAPPIVAGAPFRTLAGQRLLLFAKSRSLYPVPLHDSIIAPTLGAAAMAWETWQHGRNLPQICGSGGQNASFTIAAVEVPRGASWTVGQDHSKWGYTSAVVPPCCAAAAAATAADVADNVTPCGETGGRPALETDGPTLDPGRSVAPAPAPGGNTTVRSNNTFGRSETVAMCFSDLNRQEAQSRRGGGAVCFVGLVPLRGAFAAITTELEPCEATKAAKASRDTKAVLCRDRGNQMRIDNITDADSHAETAVRSLLYPIGFCAGSLLLL